MEIFEEPTSRPTSGDKRVVFICITKKSDDCARSLVDHYLGKCSWGIRCYQLIIWADWNEAKLRTIPANLDTCSLAFRHRAKQNSRSVTCWATNLQAHPLVPSYRLIPPRSFDCQCGRVPLQIVPRHSIPVV